MRRQEPTPALPSKEEIIQAMMLGQQTSGGGKDTPMVWLPGKKKTGKAKRAPSGPLFMKNPQGEAPSLPFYGREKDTTIPGDKSADDVYNWIYDDKKRSQIISFLQDKGYEPKSMDDVEKIWKEAVGRASDSYMTSGGKKKMSPWDILDLYSPAGGKDGLPGKGGSGDNSVDPFPWRGNSFTETSTTEHIQEMGPEQARGILTNALTDALGRAPTQEEIEDFASRANAIVSANPQRSETTSTYEWDDDASLDNEGQTQGGYRQTGSSTREVGPSAEEVAAMVQNEAMDDSMENPEYGAYQASTTYYNALLQAIASPV